MMEICYDKNAQEKESLNGEAGACSKCTRLPCVDKHCAETNSESPDMVILAHDLTDTLVLIGH